MRLVYENFGRSQNAGSPFKIAGVFAAEDEVDKVVVLSASHPFDCGVRIAECGIEMDRLVGKSNMREP